jgi:hypothetical protein
MSLKSIMVVAVTTVALLLPTSAGLAACMPSSAGGCASAQPGGCAKTDCQRAGSGCAASPTVSACARPEAPDAVRRM